jgi:hypothetical protein
MLGDLAQFLGESRRQRDAVLPSLGPRAHLGIAGDLDRLGRIDRTGRPQGIDHVVQIGLEPTILAERGRIDRQEEMPDIMAGRVRIALFA